MDSKNRNGQRLVVKKNYMCGRLFAKPVYLYRALFHFLTILLNVLRFSANFLECGKELEQTLVNSLFQI